MQVFPNNHRVLENGPALIADLIAEFARHTVQPVGRRKKNLVSLLPHTGHASNGSVRGACFPFISSFI
jgi:hypothetical protein